MSLKSILYAEEEEDSKSGGKNRANKLTTMKKAFGGVLIPFFIIIMGLFFFFSGSKYIEPNNSELFNFFGSKSYFMVFIAITLFIIPFALIHIIHFLLIKNYNDTKNNRDFITFTFAGYILLIVAYLIILLTIIIYINDKTTSMIAKIAFGLFSFIAMILLSVGLSKLNNLDNKEKSLKGASVMAPVFISINAILLAVVPFVSNINFDFSESNSLSSFEMPLIEESMEKSMNKTNINRSKSAQAFYNAAKILK